MWDKQIVVSVVMITYKHEEYLADAINGVLMQECDFDVELIIADDCSPDRTKEVVEGFQSHKNYHWIKYIRHAKNRGMMSNLIWAFSYAKGIYIAICEGDDYWTDKTKLQRQVDILESDRSLIGCFHNVEMRYESALKQSHAQISLTDRERYTKFDISKNNIIPTLSIVFRNIAIPEIHTKEFLRFSFGDWPLFLLLLRNGDFYYIPNIMGVRLINKGGIWSARSKVENLIKIENTVLELVKYKWFDDEINYNLSSEVIRLKRQFRVKGGFRLLIRWVLNKTYKSIGLLIEKLK